MQINPLQAWFQRTGAPKIEFADRNDIARNTLFDILGDKRKDYGIGTLLKIENGTKGRVTVLMMVKWINRRRNGERVRVAKPEVRS